MENQDEASKSVPKRYKPLAKPGKYLTKPCKWLTKREKLSRTPNKLVTKP